MYTRLLLLAMSAAIVVYAADNPLNGTWKRNPAKSKAANTDVPKDLTLKCYEEGGKQILEFNGTHANGLPINMKFAYPTGGGTVELLEAPKGQEPAWFDLAKAKIIDSHHLEFTYLKSGKVVGQRYATVSPDGKTYTATFKGRTSDGKTIIDDGYMEKQ